MLPGDCVGSIVAFPDRKVGVSPYIDAVEHNPADRDLVKVQLAQRVLHVLACRAAPPNKEEAMIDPAGDQCRISHDQDRWSIDDDGVILEPSLLEEHFHA